MSLLTLCLNIKVCIILAQKSKITGTLWYLPVKLSYFTILKSIIVLTYEILFFLLNSDPTCEAGRVVPSFHFSVCVCLCVCNIFSSSPSSKHSPQPPLPPSFILLFTLLFIHKIYSVMASILQPVNELKLSYMLPPPSHSTQPPLSSSFILLSPL